MTTITKKFNLTPSVANSTKLTMCASPDKPGRLTVSRDKLSRLRREAIRHLKSKLYTDDAKQDN